MKLVDEINSAFARRQMPSTLALPREQLGDSEMAEALAFLGKPSSAVTADLLQDHFEFIYWLTPSAFFYYLPAILRTSIEENRPNLIVNASIVDMLARTPTMELLDDFFLSRWGSLNREEYAALQSWLVWLSENGDGAIDDASLERAFDMVEWLKRFRSE